MSKSVGVKKKSIWRDKASWELLMLCVPTLLAFTLFHYEPPARIWSCSQPERQSNFTSTIQRANITSKNISPCRISIRQPYSPPTSIHRAEMQENRSVSPSVVLHEPSLPTA